jgi:hypothetical protein
MAFIRSDQHDVYRSEILLPMSVQVMGRLCGNVSSTSGVPQAAADLVHRASRLTRAKFGTQKALGWHRVLQ